MLFEASPPVLSKGTAASPSFDVDFIRGGRHALRAESKILRKIHYSTFFAFSVQFITGGVFYSSRHTRYGRSSKMQFPLGEKDTEGSFRREIRTGGNLP